MVFGKKKKEKIDEEAKGIILEKPEKEISDDELNENDDLEDEAEVEEEPKEKLKEKSEEEPEIKEPVLDKITPALINHEQRIMNIEARLFRQGV